MEDELFKLDDQWHVAKLNVGPKTNIRWAIRRPRGDIKSLLVFINGRMEFIEKYDYFAADLQQTPEAAHTAFLTWDHRGQGQSDGYLYHIDDFQTFIRDAAKVIDAALDFCKLKSYLMMGHSMGSLIAILGINQGVFSPSRLLLGSAFLDFPKAPPMPAPLRRKIFETACRLGFSQKRFPYKRSSFDWAGNRLTFCPHRYQRIIRTPYTEKEPTFGWLKAVDAVIKKAHDKRLLKKWQVPTLMLLAEDERVVHPSAAISWYETVANATKSKIRYEAIPHSRHELLSERPETYAQVFSLIKDHFFR